MKRTTKLAFLAAIAIIAWVALAYGGPPSSQSARRPDLHYVAGGALRFERPDDFGLAVTDQQVLVRSYIPPCNPGFDYCLYYNAPVYDGTNFESAGLRIQRRADLSSEDACLLTPPAGYSEFQPAVREGAGFATSEFAPISDAAMGHYATGSLYRLFVDAACFEFETRIGQSQFVNYDPGSIEEFTAADKEALSRRLGELLA